MRLSFFRDLVFSPSNGSRKLGGERYGIGEDVDGSWCCFRVAKEW